MPLPFRTTVSTAPPFQSAARTAAEAYQTRYLQDVSSTEADRRLKTSRDARLSRLHLAARRDVATLRAAHRAEVDRKRKELQDRIFMAPEGIDPREYHQALRDVSSVTNLEQLERMTKSALRVGDAATAHACFARAVTLNPGPSNQVVTAYAAVRPEGAEQHAALYDFEDRVLAAEQEIAGPLRPPMTPFSLRGLNDIRLQQLAASDPDPEAPAGAITNSGLPIMPLSTVQG